MNGTYDNAESQPNPGAQPAAESPPAPPRQALPNGPRQRWNSADSTAFDPRSKSPILACFLSIMPGLGQIYVGYYQRGFAHIVIFGTVITLLANGVADPLLPLLGIFLPFFVLYNIVDAGRRAASYNHAIAGGEEPQIPSRLPQGSSTGTLFGGLALLFIGVVLFMHTKMGMPLDWVEDWWPVAPIGLGAYLVMRSIQERLKRDDA